MAFRRYFSPAQTRRSTAAGDQRIIETDANESPVAQPVQERQEKEADSLSATQVDSEEPASKKRKLNDKWLDEFNWLFLKDSKMFCRICCDAAKASKKLASNGFILGSVNKQRSTLVRHQASQDHKTSTSIREQKAVMQSIQVKHFEGATDSLTAQTRTAVAMAVENIPDRKFTPLLRLQKKNKAPALQDAQQWYKRSESCKEMQAAAAAVCDERMLQRLQDSPYVGIMLDESLDIAIHKKLVIYFKILVDCVPQVIFGTNCEVKDSKAETIVAAVKAFLEKMNIPLDKVAGKGTDGANAMIGRHNGVTTVMQRDNPIMISVWCCAHRLALVAHWAASAVAGLKKLQDTLVCIFNFFKYSATRYNQLKELKQIMGEQVRRFKKPTAVRWLSLTDAVDAAEQSWGCLVLALENEAAKKDVTTAGLLREVKTFRFISLLALLKDVLSALKKCSLTVQKDQIDIDEVSKSLRATLGYIESLAIQAGLNVRALLRAIEHNGGYQGIQFQISENDKGQLNNTTKVFVREILQEAGKRFPDAEGAGQSLEP